MKRLNGQVWGSVEVGRGQVWGSVEVGREMKKKKKWKKQHWRVRRRGRDGLGRRWGSW